MISRLLGLIALLAVTGGAAAQSTNAPATAPSDTPSTAPAAAPSAAPSTAPATAPSNMPSTAPSGTPNATATPSTPPPSAAPARGETAVGGMSKCENMLGNDRDACFQKERAGTGSTR
jgi:hypothetical protein